MVKSGLFMKRRFVVAFLFAAVVIAMSARAGGSVAAPFSGAALALSSPKASALTRIDYACGWTYSCTDLGNGGNGPTQVQIYGPVNVYTGADFKPEVWRVPEGASPWTGQDSVYWQGPGCSGHPCDERCGAFCWFNRVRNGYCGHGCNAYREHVMFQPIGGNLRPYVYQNPPDGYCGYGSSGRYGYGCGGGQGPRGYGYGYGSGQGYGGGQVPVGYASAQDSYSQTSVQQGYDYSQNAPQDYGAPAPNGERFIDRLRRYFYGRPRREVYGDNGAVRDNGPVRFERPSNDLVPLRRFNGPKYPPNSTGTDYQRPK